MKSQINCHERNWNIFRNGFLQRCSFLSSHEIQAKYQLADICQVCEGLRLFGWEGSRGSHLNNWNDRFKMGRSLKNNFLGGVIRTEIFENYKNIKKPFPNIAFVKCSPILANSWPNKFWFINEKNTRKVLGGVWLLTICIRPKYLLLPLILYALPRKLLQLLPLKLCNFRFH